MAGRRSEPAQRGTQPPQLSEHVRRMDRPNRVKKGSHPRPEASMQQKARGRKNPKARGRLQLRLCTSPGSPKCQMASCVEPATRTLAKRRLCKPGGAAATSYPLRSRYTKTAILAHACYCDLGLGLSLELKPGPPVQSLCSSLFSCRRDGFSRLLVSRASSPARRSSASRLNYYS